MLENSWSLRVKFPQAKGATFAGQGTSTTNQHDLRYFDQSDLSLQEVLNAALQQGHVLGRPQSSPLLTHDTSRGGGPERKAGGATYWVPLGAVI